MTACCEFVSPFSFFSDTPLVHPCADSTWTYWSDANSCYKFFKERKTWDSASAYCLGIESQLVQIQSPKENTFVANFGNVYIAGNVEKDSIGRSDIWIGLHQKKIAPHGAWTWVSSKKVATYTNWAPGQPENGNAHCALIWLNRYPYTFKWDNQDCKLQNFFVCERGEDEINASPYFTATQCDRSV